MEDDDIPATDWLPPPLAPVRGRGAVTNVMHRFEKDERSASDDGWAPTGEDDLPPLRTTVVVERARKIMSRNDSPDISFDRSINPYRGC